MFSTAYLTVFPSLINAMSGYEASIATRLLLPNGTAIAMDRNYYSNDSKLFFDNCTNLTPDDWCAAWPNDTCFEFYDKTLRQSYNDFEKSGTEFYAEKPENIDRRTDQNLYHWGFSGEWLLVVACVNSSWLFGLWILWLDVDTQS